VVGATDGDLDGAVVGTCDGDTEGPVVGVVEGRRVGACGARKGRPLAQALVCQILDHWMVWVL
jgi:hypothetical protein